MIVRRVILALIVVLLLLLAVPVTFVALNVPVDLAPFKKPLSNMVSRQLGMDVSITGDMRLVPGLEPTFEMQGLEIADPVHAQDGDSISLGLARIRIDILAMLFGGIQIEELTAEDIQVVVVLGREGGAPVSPAESQDAAASEPPRATADGDGSALVFKGLERLALRRISIDARNLQSEKRHHFVLNEMTGAATMFQPLTLKAHGTYQAQPFRVEMSGETVEKILLLKWSWPLEMTGEISGLKMALTPIRTDTDASTGANLDYRLEISGKRFDDLDDVVGVSLPPLGPYSIAGRFSVFAKRYAISDFALRVGESNLEGNFNLDVADEIPRIEIDLIANTTRLQDFDLGDWSPVEAESAPESKTAQESGEHPSPTVDSSAVMAAFDPEILKNFYFRLSFKANKIASPDREFGSGSVTVLLDDGIIKLDPLKIEVPEGLVELAMVFDPGSRPDATALLPVSVSAKAADTLIRFERAEGTTVGTPQAPGQLRYRVSVDGKRLDSFDSFAGVSLPPVGPYTLNSLVTVRESHFAIEDLDVRVGRSDLKGNMLLDMSGERPRTEVHLATDVLQLEDFIFEDWSLVEPVVEAKPEGGDNKNDSAPEVDREQFAALLSREAMTLVDASFGLDVRQVLLGEEKLGSGKLGVKLEDGRLDVKPVRLDIPGGGIDITLALEPGESDMFAETTINVDRFDYGVLARRQQPDTDMEGLISLDVSLNTRADRPENMMANANGHMLFGIWPGNIDADVFELWTVNLMLAIIRTVDEGPRSQVNCVVAGLEFNEGLATNLSLLMDTTNMQVSGEIEANFKTEHVHVYLKPQAKRPQFFSAATPVEVDGNFSDFGIAPAPGALIGTVVRMVTSIVTVPVKRLFREEIPEDGESACAVAFQGGVPDGR